jgi:hypothetical protein
MTNSNFSQETEKLFISVFGTDQWIRYQGKRISIWEISDSAWCRINRIVTRKKQYLI